MEIIQKTKIHVRFSIIIIFCDVVQDQGFYIKYVGSFYFISIILFSCFS